MRRDQLSLLSALLAVAEERSFTRAAKRLRVTPSALSHAIRGLEEQVGVRLLARTTRSVSPTDAGEQLLSRLRPALAEVNEALESVSGLRDQPAGHVRLLVARHATPTLAPRLTRFALAYPDVVLDVTTSSEGHVDLVGGGFDAGINFREYVELDMIAVRVSPDHRAAIVGSPSYFAARPVPESPRALAEHRCINFRHGTEGVYRWEFEKGDEALTVSVNGPLIVDDVDLMVRAALAGAGLAFVSEERVGQELASGQLVRVLDDWCPPFDGYYLYYPSRRHQPAALVALIEALRLS